jgi:hypothetical protein
VGLSGDTIVNDEQKMEALQHAMAQLQASCAKLPVRCESHVGNALLNLSLGYLIDLHGQPGAATILSRLVDALMSDQLPNRSDRALDAVRLDG